MYRSNRPLVLVCVIWGRKPAKTLHQTSDVAKSIAYIKGNAPWGIQIEAKRKGNRSDVWGYAIWCSDSSLTGTGREWGPAAFVNTIFLRIFTA
jgi:hypothetical protein